MAVLAGRREMTDVVGRGLELRAVAPDAGPRSPLEDRGVSLVAVEATSFFVRTQEGPGMMEARRVPRVARVAHRAGRRSLPGVVSGRLVLRQMARDTWRRGIRVSGVRIRLAASVERGQENDEKEGRGEAHARTSPRERACRACGRSAAASWRVRAGRRKTRPPCPACGARRGSRAWWPSRATRDGCVSAGP